MLLFDAGGSTALTEPALQFLQLFDKEAQVRLARDIHVI
jgi:hypothetical protein